MVIRSIDKLKEEGAPLAEPIAKECGLCQMTIPLKAIKCGYCTTELKAKD
jgi:large conductance mechanosensitive channel